MENENSQEKKSFIDKIKEHKLYVQACSILKQVNEWRKSNKLAFWIMVFGSICILIIFSYLHCQPNEMAMPTPEVTVVKVESKTVPMYVDYVGTSESIRSVDIRARVEGFLVKRYFVEGADVKQGDLMFEIDPRPFQAELDDAKAELLKNEAALKFANDQVARYTELVEKEYITREDYDNIVTKADEAKAEVKADKARVDQAELNLSYCKMYAPVNGRVGRTFVHEGNLVGAGQDTKLATVVQLDPIYIYFSPSEKDYRHIAQYAKDTTLEAQIKFPDGSVHPYKGKLDFVDNIVNPDTSTIKMRVTVPNPDKALLPGIYANVNLKLAEEPNTLLVPRQALAEDQGGAYVYIVDKESKTLRRDVETGPDYNNMATIKKGLKKGDEVVVKGMQKIRPGTKVKATLKSDKDKSKK